MFMNSEPNFFFLNFPIEYLSYLFDSFLRTEHGSDGREEWVGLVQSTIGTTHYD
jgi:hypothetical protein